MTTPASPPRRSECTRRTAETTITGSLVIDGSGKASVNTGVGFLDHMLTALACHGGMDLTLECAGDLDVDDHHTVEDCAIVLGTLLNDCLGDRRAINRFGHAYAPLDESLARAVVDLATRPSATIDLGLRREKLGELSCENAPHFFATLSSYGRFCLHLDVLRGINDHHRLEAAFKAFSLALKHAVRLTSAEAPASTKGVL